jgi:hypothetical protein
VTVGGFSGHQQASGTGRRRRWKLILAGVAIAAIGLLAAVGGLVAGQISDAVSNLDPVAEATMPSPARFDAEPRRYDVAVTVRRRGTADSRAVETRCDVEFVDGTTARLDGSRQAIATSTGGIASVGWFDAVAGPTTVRCSGADDGTRYVIDEYSTTDRIALWVALTGVAVLIVGAALIVTGALWTKPPKAALTPR